MRRGGREMRRWEEEEDNDKWGRMLLRGGHRYSEMYVFLYTCNWARVVFIRISWHI
jgi:hypothetical protein